MSDQYDFTVDKLRGILDEISKGGNGGDIVAIKANMVNGYSVSPITEISGGSLDISDGKYNHETINEDGEGFVFIASSGMLPVGFWKRQLSH